MPKGHKKKHVNVLEARGRPLLPHAPFKKVTIAQILKEAQEVEAKKKAEEAGNLGSHILSTF